MGLLMMIATIGGLILAFILLVYALWRSETWLVKYVLGAAAVWFVIYAAMLFGSSLLSEEKTLALNEPKEFCGAYIDCHMHAAVTNVKKTKTIGNKTTSGEFYIVKVKVFSDAKAVELGLHAPKFTVLDAEGRRFERVEDLTLSGNPFEQKLPAGGAFEGEVVFDLPTDVKNPLLDIRDGVGIDKVIESVLIGDEDSIGHKRNYFKLEAQTQTAGVK